MDSLGDLDDLAERLPPGAVSTHHGELAAHARDRWALALLREVRGDRFPPPAALVYASTVEEVSTTLEWATRTRTPVVPRGGGSGLVGGAQAVRRAVVLDVSRLNRVGPVDPVSQTVSVQAGVRGRELEAALVPHGLTTGHDLVTHEIATVGGWIASASAGLASSGYGAVEDLVAGLTVVLPGGPVVALGPVPRWGTGPDLRRLFVGAEGTLGVVVEATLSLSRAPGSLVWDAFLPHSFETGAAVLRELAQEGVRPAVLRLFDADDAAASLPPFGRAARPLLVAAFDPAGPLTEAARAEVRRLARDVGARRGPAEVAEDWWARRHDAVGWLDDVMGPDRSMGPGVVADLLDVAAPWRHVPRLYEELRGVLLGSAGEVRCSLTDAYRSGAGLLFSFLLRAGDDAEAERRYRETWERAAGAALAAGGTMVHNHGVGVLRLPFVAAQLGPGGVGLLRRVKDALDPEGVMNPGKLVPPAGGEAAR